MQAVPNLMPPRIYRRIRSREAKARPGARELEICILAGGLSTRLGRDKAKVRLAGKTLLSRIKEAAKKTGKSVRVIRKDLVPRCGPIGGIFTGLVKSRAESVVFLTCDMPFISAELMGLYLKPIARGKMLFAKTQGKWGFPLRVGKEAVPIIREQIVRGQFSVQRLAAVLNVQAAIIPKRMRSQLLNVNTQQDLERARAHVGPRS
jgi:molybdopterin-guanine dinucleotide biosynthesis protein A